jgi:YVTN family beta-propeller protein
MRGAILTCLLVLLPAIVSDAQAFTPAIQVRRPVALCLSENQEILYVANRDSGTISVVRLADDAVIEEIAIGGQPTDMALLSDGRLLVVDQQHNRLVIVRSTGKQAEIDPIEVAASPVRIIVDSREKYCYVSSLWSTTVSKFALSNDTQTSPKLVQSKKLHFAPRELCLTPDENQLIVASAFAAKIAVLNGSSLESTAVHSMLGHNIQGLAINEQSRELIVAQQELNPLAHATQDDVHWGNMMSNQLAKYPLDKATDPDVKLVDHRTVTQLGEPGAAAADPGSFVLQPDGRTALILTGTHEVAFLDDSYTEIRQRLRVGTRPMDLAAAKNGRLYVANMFADSISVIDATRKVATSISLGEQPELTAAQQGEILFFDGRLSHDGWMSCHSCHTEGHSNERLNDNFSDGTFGTPKRVLSLLGVAETSPWAWNGETKSLEQQVKNSIEITMRGDAIDDDQVDAIVDFMHTLTIPQVTNSQPTEKIVASLARGKQLFESSGCITCHAPPVYTTPKSYDVGLVDAEGLKHFNPPSLRAVAHRANFFHDGRADSLHKVFTKYKHQVGEGLDAEQVESLTLFLNSLASPANPQ